MLIKGDHKELYVLNMKMKYLMIEEEEWKMTKNSYNLNLL